MIVTAARGAMAWLGDFLHRYPDLAVFAGLLIGQLGHVPVSGTAKSILFLM